MALKAIIDSLDSVEEQFRSLYEEKDGKFVLIIEGIESHPRAAAPKSALDRVRGEKRTISEKLQRPKAGWKACRETSTPMLTRPSAPRRKAKSRRRSKSVFYSPEDAA